MASDAAAFDEFGRSVSLSGDTALVGAWLNEAAYVFEKPAGGWMTMTETAKLTASAAAAEDRFGWSVSLSGDTALVAAEFDDDACPLDPGCNSGSVHVFEKPAGGWMTMTETAKLTASDAAAADLFGWRVSLSGDTALVGAILDDDAGTASGSAYVLSVSGPCLTGPTPGMVAVVNTLTLSNATPGGLVGVGFSLTPGSTPVGAFCPGLTVDLANPTVIGLMTADGSGNASFSGFVPASLSGTTAFLQGVDIPACEVTNLVEHTFP